MVFLNHFEVVNGQDYSGKEDEVRKIDGKDVRYSNTNL